MMSRREPATDGKEWLCDMVAGEIRRVKSAWLYRWPDRMESWRAWDVAALIGDVGSWREVFLLRFSDLGKHPLPALSERWRYIKSLDMVDPCDIPRERPVLHHTTRLYEAAYWPGKLVDVMARHNAAVFSEVERKLDELGIPENPEGQTRAGIDRLLAMQGLELAGPTDPLRGRESGKPDWRVRSRMEVERDISKGVAALSGL
jgi:hypothetical protein